MVDDSHAVGCVGAGGRGTPELCGVADRVDILTGTLGKALGGASGGYTSGRREVVEMLRQRSRPYLFSNTLAPVIAAASLTALDLVEDGRGRCAQRLDANAAQLPRARWRRSASRWPARGHPIIPVMLGDARLAQDFADRLLARGVYVIGFSFPVVPRGQARIRTQMSAAHSPEDVAAAIAAFAAVGRELGVIRMNNEMRALVKARPEPGLWMQEVPVPEPGPNDVLIKVAKSAICGTDVHIWNWDAWAAATVPVPMVVGHEFVGRIADTGAAVTRFKPGERVSGEGHIVCGFCRNCRAGRGHLCRNTLGVGVHRPGSLRRVPLHSRAQRRGDPRRHPRRDRGDLRPVRQRRAHGAQLRPAWARTCWSPAPGRSASWARWSPSAPGARKVVITDINPTRLELARRMGVDYVVDATREDLADVMRAIGMREGFDIGLEMSGAAPAFRDMIDKMNNGGKIAILGIAPAAFEIDWNKVIFKMLILKGIYGREMFETWYKMIALVQSGLDLSPLITHRHRHRTTSTKASPRCARAAPARWCSTGRDGRVSHLPLVWDSRRISVELPQAQRLSAGERLTGAGAALAILPPSERRDSARLGVDDTFVVAETATCGAGPQIVQGASPAVRAAKLSPEPSSTAAYR